MPNEAFIEALVELADERGNTNWLIALRDKAFDKIAAGGGEVGFITQATLNGKTGQQERVMDAQELFSACQAALRRYRGQEVSVTYADFSSLS